MKKYGTQLNRARLFLAHHPYRTSFLGVSASVFFIGIILFFFTYGVPTTEIVAAKEIERPPQATKTANEPIVGVTIGNNGLVFIKGARVASITKTTLVVNTSWNITNLQWTVTTNESVYEKRHFGTSFLDAKGAVKSLTDLRVGDIVSINGTFDDTFLSPTINASLVRTLE